MKWILLVVIMNYRGSTISGPEFNTYEACYNASVKVAEAAKGQGYAPPAMFCVEKGKEK